MSLLPLKELSQAAKNLGIQFLAVSGPADQGLASEMEARYRSWIDLGRAGSMDYLERHGDFKFRPDALLPGCRSIIVLGLNYYQEAPWPKGLHLGKAEGSGRVARYAWGRDYHKTFKQMLQNLAASCLGQKYVEGEEAGQNRERNGSESRGFWRVFTDSGPLHERFFAEAAGIGFTGRHSLTITHEYGSWIFLGLILSTMESKTAGEPQDPLRPRELSVQGRCPSSCTRCIQVCPTGALKGPHDFDASLCISYLTIEHKGSIPLELRSKMGDWVFGCDLCQEVCPLNLRAKITSINDFRKARAGSELELEEILGMRSQEEFLARFAGGPLMRAGLERMQRNACVAAGNKADPKLAPVLETLRVQTESELVREHAAWALERIGKRPS